MAEEKKALTLLQLTETPSVISRFAKCLGNDETKAQAFLRSVINCTQINPALKRCDPLTVLGSAMMAASLDLEVSQGLGYAALIPYGNKCTFQIMTDGYTQLFFRSGQAKALNSFVVFEDEYNGFDKIKGELKPLKEHNDNCTKIVGYGCYIALTNGFEKTIYWTAEKVREHATKYSQAFRSGKESPWSTAYDAMALKTVQKYALVHFAPKSLQMQYAIQADQSSITAKDNGEFEFEYVDNPSNSAPVTTYTDEEMTRRTELLDLLKLKGIEEKNLCTLCKVDDVMEIPTEKLEERVNALNEVENAN